MLNREANAGMTGQPNRTSPERGKADIPRCKNAFAGRRNVSNCPWASVSWRCNSAFV
ncbi:MAG: hypothetical protein ACR2PL_07575 [Dehalococcoidia bacterium]